ncbi:MAG: hypothetical protein ACKVQB_12735, partial [Bacteroidia bacterium]
MKKVFLTLLISSAFTASFAQTSKAIYTSGSYSEIGDFNPTDATFSNPQFAGNVITTPRDFIYDAKNGHVIYQDKTNGLVFSTLSGNKINPKSLNMNTNVMAPAYIPSSESVICFNVQKEFNGYGSNEENLFLSKIDVNKGTIKNLIKFSDLSFDNVSAPFYGKVTTQDRFTGKMTDKDVAISKPIYVPEKDLYIVLIRDVTGTNRLYKIHVNSPTANVSSTRCDYNIIDMKHLVGTEIAKALFFEKSGNNYELKVGDLNITTNEMTNITYIKSFSSNGKTIIDNGSIKFNNDQSQLYVSSFEAGQTNIYNLNIDNNQNNSVKSFSGYIQFDFGFNESYYKPVTYSSIF